MYAVSIGVRGERDRDPRAELDALRVLGRDHEREERITSRLRREEAVVPDLFEFLCAHRDVVERARHDSGVYLHGPDPTSVLLECASATRVEWQIPLCFPGFSGR